MSEVPQGPGWWIASDGRWYRPEDHPAHRAPPPPAPRWTPSAQVPPQWPPPQWPPPQWPRPSWPGQPWTGYQPIPVRQKSGRAAGLVLLASILTLVVLLTVGVVFVLRPSGSLTAFQGTGRASPTASVPETVNSPGTVAAAARSVRIVALGCYPNGYGTGTGWPVATHYIVTAAHVVSGASQVAIQIPDGTEAIATVTFFDSSVDYAVLYVPGARFVPLHYATRDPSSQEAAAIGFPSPQEMVVSASLLGVQQFYGDYPVAGALHTGEVMDAPGVAPGFSGGPVVDQAGTVVGMTVDGDPNGSGRAFATLPSQMATGIASGLAGTSGVATGSCAVH